MKNCCRERFHQLKEANLEYSAAMEEMNQELGNSSWEQMMESEYCTSWKESGYIINYL